MSPAESRLRGALLGALFVSALFAAPPLHSVDWGWHLMTGLRLLDEGAVPFDDIYMWTSEGQRVLPVFWGFDLIMGLAERAGGIAGLFALRALLILSIEACLAFLLAQRGLPGLPTILLLALIACIAQPRLILRPHLLSFLFTLITIGCVDRARLRQERWLIPLPIIFLLWANAHPGVVLGLGVLGALGLGILIDEVWLRSHADEADRKRGLRMLGIMIAVGILCGLLTLLTPAGYELYPWIWEHRKMFAEQAIVEMRPIRLTETRDLAFLGFELGLLVLARPNKNDLRRDLPLWCAALVYLLLAAETQRFIPQAMHLLAIAAAAPLARSLKAPTRLGKLLIGVALVGLSYGLLTELRRPRPLLDPALHAPGAGAFLRDHKPPGPIYNSNRLGGHLITYTRGDPKLMWDGRQPIYRHLAGLDFSALDARFHFKALVLADLDPPLSVELPKGRKDWTLVFFSDQARIYLRNDAPETAELRQRFGFKGLYFRWAGVSARSYDLRPAINPSKLQAALAELKDQRARDPGGYYTNFALAEASMLAGRPEQAALAAARARRARDSVLIRMLERKIRR